MGQAVAPALLVVGAATTLASSIEQATMLREQARMLGQQANMQERSAEVSRRAALLQGMEQETHLRRQLLRDMGMATASLAGSGVALGAGTAATTLDSIRREGMRRISRTGSNARLASLSAELSGLTRASSLRSRARIARRQARVSLISGISGATQLGVSAYATREQLS